MNLIRIDSVLGGEAPSQFFAGGDQSLAMIGLDPDLPVSDAVGDRLTSGILRPSGYAAFDSTQNDGNPYWILTSPKTALVYTYLGSGKFNSYSATLGSETNIGTPTSGAGNGAAYYNNYIYLATPTNISRYGPLDGTAALTNTVWTGSTLGTQTALTNTTYPSIRGSGTLPNHPMHVHTDNRLYVGDFVDGQGAIHFVKTTKVTDQGDTNDGSTYNALDLPFGFMPTCIDSFGTFLVIGAIQTTNATLDQGKAALFFWDTSDPNTFFNQVPLPDPLVTALKNVNGTLYGWSGSISTGSDISNGYRLFRYDGGYAVTTIHLSTVGSPPLAGAVDSIGDRLVWGTFDQIPSTTAASPEYYAVVKAYGSKDKRLPAGPISIVNASASASASDGLVTALKVVQNASLSSPQMVVGWRDANNYGLDKKGTTYGTWVWRSRTITVGRKFIVRRIRIHLGAAIAANMTITPKVFVDGFSSSETLTVINNTNYPNSDRSVILKGAGSGKHDFCLELRGTGTALLPVLMPIEIEFDILED